MRWLVLVLAACGAGASPASARYDRCDAINVQAAPDEADAVKAIVVQRCMHDEWQGEAIDCFSAAPSVGEFDDCRGKLDEDQRKKLRVELDDVRAGLGLAKLSDLETQMCACKTKGCAAHVKTAWADYDRVHPPRGGDRRLAELARETRKCEARASHEGPLAAMTRFKDEMCACPVGDNACVTRVTDEMSKWAADNPVSGDVSPDDTTRATQLGMEMAKCMTAAMSPVGP